MSIGARKESGFRQAHTNQNMQPEKLTKGMHLWIKKLVILLVCDLMSDKALIRLHTDKIADFPWRSLYGIVELQTYFAT